MSNTQQIFTITSKTRLELLVLWKEVNNARVINLKEEKK